VKRILLKKYSETFFVHVCNSPRTNDRINAKAVRNTWLKVNYTVQGYNFDLQEFTKKSVEQTITMWLEN